jgi:hypothetical protein
MLNTEIGTYQIAEGLKLNPTLSASIDGRKITAIIDGITFVGNYDIIQKVCNCSKIKSGLNDNIIIISKKPTEVLADVYGIYKEKDWEAVYNKEETWRLAKLNATEEDKKHKQSKFTLTNYGKT